MNSLRFKGILLVGLFLQVLNLVFAIGNVISNPNYKVSVWQYILALTMGTISIVLLAISLISRKELAMLLFNAREEQNQEINKIS
jgi:hypothetical protein